MSLGWTEGLQVLLVSHMGRVTIGEVCVMKGSLVNRLSEEKRSGRVQKGTSSNSK